jgi:hypothetical protein
MAGAPGSLACVLMSELGLDADSFLVELDGRLRAIQAELRPGVAVPAIKVQQMEADPAPVRRGRSGPLSALLGRTRGEAGPDNEDSTPGDTSELLAQVRALTETQARLLEASERLLEAFTRAVESPAGLFAATSPSPRRAAVEIAVGPFPDTEALRGFERALEQLEPVRRVTVRGYEGSDRAIFDVEIAP